MGQSDLRSSAPRLCPRHQGLGVGEFMVYGFVFKSVHAYAKKILKGKKKNKKRKFSEQPQGLKTQPPRFLRASVFPWLAALLPQVPLSAQEPLSV